MTRVDLAEATVEWVEAHIAQSRLMLRPKVIDEAFARRLFVGHLFGIHVEETVKLWGDRLCFVTNSSLRATQIRAMIDAVFVLDGREYHFTLIETVHDQSIHPDHSCDYGMEFYYETK